MTKRKKWGLQIEKKKKEKKNQIGEEGGRKMKTKEWDKEKGTKYPN